MWVCGLKLSLFGIKLSGFLSHPMWVCGLKLYLPFFYLYRQVTPHVGVWIETDMLSWVVLTSVSHPMWVCGLKRKHNRLSYHYSVTPHVGVWIETTSKARSTHDA